MYSLCVRLRGCFLAHKTHTTFTAYYNVPVESKTVKFDIIVHLRDSTFTPAAMQSPSSRKFPFEEANSQLFYEMSFFEEMSFQHAYMQF